MTKASKIIYTKTDESPALATYSLFPIVSAFTKTADIDIELVDISLVGRIIASFPENLTPEQKQPDALAQLGELTKNPEANIVKLPNISASVPQLLAAIKELKEHGYNIPDYPLDPKSKEEEQLKTRFSKILGSAVNPVLREGNSDRRAADAVKLYAKNNPHSMGEWTPDSKSHVAHMTDGDFYGTEKSYVTEKEDAVRIELLKKDGSVQILKKKVALLPGEVIDGSAMSIKALCDFYEKEIEAAKEEDVLLSLHLKATMMKVSDPIMFGHAVKVYYKDVFKKFADVFAKVGVNANNGLGDVYNKIADLPEAEKKEIEDAISAVYNLNPELAMVNANKGITNLHVPSDVIIDASMPAAIRTSGKMWGKDGKLKDMKAMIPDRCYAGIYQETINFCKENGAFDVTTMGNVSNVGLMAQKAEEYGSHDKTFEIPADGTVRVVNTNDVVVFEHTVEKGDIWRMCQTKDLPVKDWVKLAVNRAKATGFPAIFWLDENRAHDRNIIAKVEDYLKQHDLTGLEVKILNPLDAMQYTLKRVKAGENTISVTGNVLRDYLTDLFPILELGTSAKMLSIVPLLAGGGLYETGAGGSAPVLVQQFLEENHFIWDSLGEFMALAVSIEDLGIKTDNKKAVVLAKALDTANSMFLQNDKSPLPKVGELDTRGSHFYLTLYWAKALAEQTEDTDLQNKFKPLAEALEKNEEKIVADLINCQGVKVNIGGYYQPDCDLASGFMRPSKTFNEAIEAL